MATIVQVGAKVYDGSQWIETGASFEYEQTQGTTLDMEL